MALKIGHRAKKSTGSKTLSQEGSKKVVDKSEPPGGRGLFLSKTESAEADLSKTDYSANLTLAPSLFPRLLPLPLSVITSCS